MPGVFLESGLHQEVLGIFWIWLVFGGLILCFGALVYPWRTTIETRIMVEARPFSEIYVKTGGRLDSILVSKGDQVEKGQLIAKLSNPENLFRFNQLSHQIAVQKELTKLATLDADLRQQNSTIAAKLVQLETEQLALLEKINNADIYSPISGKITGLLQGTYPRQWLGQGQKLAAIKGSQGFKMTGYVSESDISRIHMGGACSFWLLKKYYQKHGCRLISISESAEQVLQHKMLGSPFGGNIPAKLVQGDLLPGQAIYKIIGHFDSEDIQLNHEALGTMKLEADKKSVIERFWHWFLAVLIRETGM